ncbi:hypothetical protein LOZ36_006562 [Ophidiomyces ophidiicola]|nr:hypothetical protein LOZ36_006562 [Ophidiomyces ophidiicola]
MRSFFFTALVAAFTATTAAAPFPGPAASPNAEAFDPSSATNFLRPIKLADLEAHDGLEARTLPDLSCFKPTQTANFLFGGLGAAGKLFMANMTLHAPENLPVVLMEEFESLTSTVDCKGDDGQMALTFKSQEAYDFAIKSWSYVNANKEKEFVLVANHAGCGLKGRRQAYKITKVVNVAAKLTVTLEAQAVAWKQFAGNFDIDFGNYKIATKALLALQSKGVIEFIGEAIDKITAGFQAGLKGGTDAIVDIVDDGNSEVCLPVNLPIKIFTPNTPVPIYKSPENPSEVDLTCKNCYVKGNFLTVGYIKVVNYVTTDFKLEIEPKDFSTAAEFQLDLVNVKKDFKYSQTIFESVIPYTGIEIPGILSVGAKVGLLIHGNIKFSGTASINFGCTTKLPNGGKITLVLVGNGKCGVVGLDKIEAKPDITFNKGKVELDTTTVPESSITYGFAILGGGVSIEAGVKFGVPIDLNVTTGNNEKGWCPGNSTKTGVTVSAGAALKLDFGVWQNKQTPIFKIPLLNFPIQCPKICKPIPEIEPGHPPTVITPGKPPVIPGLPPVIPGKPPIKTPGKGKPIFPNPIRHFLSSHVDIE